MNKEEKKQVIAEWEDRFKTVKSVVLTDFRGLNVAKLTELRNKLRQQEIGYEVIKNTLLERVAISGGCEGLREYLVGPTGVAYSHKDAVAPAKVLKSFIQNNAEFKIKAGLLEGKVINAQQVGELAELPSREVLLAILLAGFQAPLVGLVGVLQANLRQLLVALEAIKHKKGVSLPPGVSLPQSA